MAGLSADWLPLPDPPATAELCRAGISPRLARLLAHRGVETEAAAAAFLEPTVDQLHDPFLLAGLGPAVAKLLAAQEQRQAVAVVGDYDVDGVSATALLVAVLKSHGIEAHAVLPHRLIEGYGFQPVHVERAAALGCSLIVTVDCGVSALAAVEAARSRGIEVIITDHHLPGENLPAGAILVNPRQADCPYPFPHLAGVGLALKLALGLSAKSGRPVQLDSLLRIACLGTIADVVPLLGENRVIAALGLAALGTTRSVGLKALIASAGLKPPLKAADIGYRLGPRLNAAGRLASPDGALELLLTRDPTRATALARELELHNRARQEEEALVLEEARASLLARTPLPPILVAWSAGWHRGVLGIAAGRLARELMRPTLLLASDGAEAVGSGRSVPGIDLHGFVSGFRDRLIRFGGHAQAIGLAAATESLAALRAELEAAARAWPADLLRPRFEYELTLEPSEVNPAVLAELTRLEPHGQSNPQPLLRIGPLRLRHEPRYFGKGHLAAEAVGQDGERVQLLGWRWQERRSDLAGSFEALAYLERDAYCDQSILRLVDARRAEQGS